MYSSHVEQNIIIVGMYHQKRTSITHNDQKSTFKSNVTTRNQLLKLNVKAIHVAFKFLYHKFYVRIKTVLNKKGEYTFYTVLHVFTVLVYSLYNKIISQYTIISRYDTANTTHYKHTCTCCILMCSYMIQNFRIFCQKFQIRNS